MKHTTLLSIAIVTSFLTACQTIPYAGKARNVKVKPKVEGVIALPLDPRPEDRNLAETNMTRNCNPGSFEILEEGEVVIGEKKNTSGNSTHRKSTKQNVGSLFGIPVTTGQEAGTNNSSEEVTSQVKEWQISYKCIGVADNKNKKSKLR